MTSGRTLYHFTARHHLAGIRRDGRIWGGGIPIPDEAGRWLAGFRRGYQWLTTDPSWQQSWATRKRAACDRTDMRLTVAIPIIALERLARWDAVAGDFGYDGAKHRRLAELGGGSGDSSAWHVYRGPIPADWIVAVDERPATASARPAGPLARRRR